MRSRSLLAALMLVTVATAGCSSGATSDVRTVSQPGFWSVEVPSDWEIAVPPPRWVQEQDTLNATEFLDRTMQFSATAEHLGLTVSALYDPEAPIDLDRQVELQREPSPRLELDPAGVQERSARDLRILEYEATTAVAEPFPSARFLFTFVQSSARPHEAWTLWCISEGDEPAPECRAIVDSFEVAEPQP